MPRYLPKTTRVLRPNQFAWLLGLCSSKKKGGFSDEEVVEQIKENPYLQYFIGLPEFQKEAPFDPSMMVHFRKRRYGLGRIIARLQVTSETVIHLQFLVMNLERKLRLLFTHFWRSPFRLSKFFFSVPACVFQ